MIICDLWRQQKLLHPASEKVTWTQASTKSWQTSLPHKVASTKSSPRLAQSQDISGKDRTISCFGSGGSWYQGFVAESIGSHLCAGRASTSHSWKDWKPPVSTVPKHHEFRICKGSDKTLRRRESQQGEICTA